MGLSTSVSVGILLLGFVGALVLTYPSIEEGVLKLSDSYRVQHQNYEHARGTALSIENVTVQGTCTLYNVTIAVKNTGSEGILLSKLALFDNGGVLNNTLVGLLAPRKGINITYENMTSAESSHRLKVVAGNGVSAYGDYACG
jgi:archaellum component FlaF (FlaF/FlaG flagellin family)